jgi:putative tryptophan/tyrosine transport system substrate-binding protein
VRSDARFAGGLISYATNPIEELRRGADYLARVLNGESAATLPVDQTADFELALNLKTARAMGLNVPPAVLNRVNRLVG